jgi:hypothetical protein
MHFATLARLYSEIALSRKPFGIGHMYIYTFLLRMTYTMTSQNIDPSSWDTCIYHNRSSLLSIIQSSIKTTPMGTYQMKFSKDT